MLINFFFPIIFSASLPEKLITLFAAHQNQSPKHTHLFTEKVVLKITTSGGPPDFSLHAKTDETRISHFKLMGPLFFFFYQNYDGTW